MLSKMNRKAVRHLQMFKYISYRIFLKFITSIVKFSRCPGKKSASSNDNDNENLSKLGRHILQMSKCISYSLHNLSTS